MRKLIIAVAITATVALGGAFAWQASAAAPAAPVPQAAPYWLIHLGGMRLAGARIVAV